MVVARTPRTSAWSCIRRKSSRIALAEELQQHLVQQAHVHDRAVVALHELLDREGVGSVLVAEHLRDADLVVEQQPVLAAPGDHVQGEAHLPQEGLRRAQLAQLARREETVLDQFVERLGAEVPLGDPADGLHVAQPARARLYVRLEVVGRVVVAVVPGLLFGHLRFEERLRRPHVVLAERTAHRLEQVVRPAEEPRLDERRGDAHVGRALALAVVDGADAVPDLEPDVPEESQEPLDALVPVGRLALRQQDEHVDVGAGVQLAAAVAADRHEVDVLLARADVQRPRLAEHDVDHARTVPHQRLDRFVLGESLPEVGVAVCECLAEGRHPVRAVERRRERVEERPGRERDPSRDDLDFFGGRGCHAQAGGRSLVPSVSTSKPSAVTRMVCSHWADSE